jgi:LPS-assembly protein
MKINYLLQDHIIGLGKLKNILILCLIIFSQTTFANNLQLKIGETVSIYSNKAYRTEGGKKFEAVGNVVILSGNETLYGDNAVIDLDKKFFKIEGNIRFISKDVTIYGSKIQYFMDSPKMNIVDSRIVTKSFTIVAANLDRIKSNKFIAKEAEYTTCKDCPESWSLFGKEFDVEIGEYISIKNAIIRANGVNVTWIPYIVLPAKSTRQTGLLFPLIANRISEGVSIGVPWFWAISPNKDFTFTPTYWSNRGIGTDLEYRHIFSENSRLTFNTRILNDEIYAPTTTDTVIANENTFRNFTTVEGHFESGFDYNSHFRVLGLRDLDMIPDFPGYTQDFVRSTAIGLDGFTEYRNNNWVTGLESNFNKNLLNNDSFGFDHSYVQILPKLTFSYLPRTVIRSTVAGFRRISIGIDGNHTTFKQNRSNEDTNTYIRNVNRLKIRPYMDWNIFNYKNVYFKSSVFGDYYLYKFLDKDQQVFRKFSLLTETSAAITYEKIFGLSYKYKIASKKVVVEGDSPKKSKDNKYVGELPDLDEVYKNKLITMNKNSYKHSLELKLVHHQIHNDGFSGNDAFRTQIKTNEGWFDYEDALKSEEAILGGTQSRQLIPKFNTLEFQWNNVLVRKSPKNFNYLEDDRYLSDNFTYVKMGHFNISQGVIVDQAPTPSGTTVTKERLTRLLIDMGYAVNRWSFLLTEYYFHETSDNIVSLGLTREHETFKMFFNYNLNSFEQSPLKTVSYGVFYQPLDVLAFTYNQEIDLNAKQTIKTVYAVDYIPLNNCWKLGLTYSKSLVGDRISFDFLFNFGNETFRDSNETYRRL